MRPTRGAGLGVLVAVAVVGGSWTPAAWAEDDASPYRRWLDDGKTVSCEATGNGIEVVLSNQDVEFNALPPDAQYQFETLLLPDGESAHPIASEVHPVEQVSGTLAYPPYSITVPQPYPVTLTFVILTKIGSWESYVSQIFVHCEEDTETPRAVTIDNNELDPLPPTGADVAWSLGVGAFVLGAGIALLGIARYGWAAKAARLHSGPV